MPEVWNAPFGFTGRGVVVGIVDSGINIGHGSFRLKNGSTRIVRLWDQTAPTQKPPRAVPFGAEYTSQELDKILAGSPPIGELPGIEDNVKNASPAPPPTTTPPIKGPEIPHGSHVAGIAAGNGLQSTKCHGSGYFVGVAKDADLVIVKLRYTDDGGVLPALHYIAQIAAGFPDKKPRPCVINLSFGLTTLESKRSRQLELNKRVDDFLKDTRGIAVVAGIGNEGLSVYHRQLEVPANDRRSLSLEMRTIPAFGPPAEEEELRFEHTPGASLEVNLTSLRLGKSTGSWGPKDGDRQLTVGDHPVHLSSDSSNEISIKIGPSATTHEIAGGTWTVEFEETAGVPAVVDAFAKQYGTTNYLMFAGKANLEDRNDTGTAPATAASVIAVGNYDTTSRAMNEASGRGPLAFAPGEFKPDLVAPGTGILAPNGAGPYGDCCHCCSQFFVTADGTSQAAPHVTGVVALMLERNPGLTHVEIKKILRDTADPPAGVTVPNNVWGMGIVNAHKAIQAVPLPSSPPLPPILPQPAPPAPPGPPLDPDPDPDPDPAPDPDAAPGGNAVPALRSTGPHAQPPRFWINVPTLAERMRVLSALPSHRLKLVLFLISTHVDEVRRLIDYNRRVGAIWRGRGGHQLVRHLLRTTHIDGTAVVPASIEGFDMRDLFTRMFKLLARYGGEDLRGDIRRYREVFVNFPGVRLDELDTAIPIQP